MARSGKILFEMVALAYVNMDSLNQGLGKMGLQGWEVKGLSFNSNQGGHVVAYQRPVTDPRLTKRPPHEDPE